MQPRHILSLFLKGDYFEFICIFMYVTQHFFIYRPSNSTVWEDSAGSTLALTARRSNHWARSHANFNIIFTLKVHIRHESCTLIKKFLIVKIRDAEVSFLPSGLSSDLSGFVILPATLRHRH
jgi:hypothetical protein